MEGKKIKVFQAGPMWKKLNPNLPYLLRLNYLRTLLRTLY
jgi:hypothetical protein